MDELRNSHISSGSISNVLHDVRIPYVVNDIRCDIK